MTDTIFNITLHIGMEKHEVNDFFFFRFVFEEFEVN